MSALERGAAATEAQAALNRFNTLGLQARAAQLAHIETLAQEMPLLDAARAAGQPWLVLGGGSNVVLPEYFPGLVIKIGLRGRRLLESAPGHWLVEAAAGECWHELVMWTLAEGWPGLENLALIPGTVGAAPVQNIGAYGLELAERIDSLDALDLDSGQLQRFGGGDCRFAYRDSIFRQQPGRWLITAVRLRLPRPWQPELGYAELARELELAQGHDPALSAAQRLAAAVIRIRQRKLPDPALLANAGSFFKNPLVSAQQAAELTVQHPALPRYPQADGQVKLAAGWLIEQCGWKGRQLGPMGCHAQQALVLVNHGGASRQDVERIARQIAADVRQGFGVELQPEPVFVS